MKMFSHLGIIKFILAGALAVIAVVLTLTLILGGVFFENMDVPPIASWFIGVLFIVFVSLFVYALIAFILWFLFTKPYVFFVFIGALILVFLGIIVFWLIKRPVYDLGVYLQPIFSFLK